MICHLCNWHLQTSKPFFFEPKNLIAILQTGDDSFLLEIRQDWHLQVSHIVLEQKEQDGIPPESHDAGAVGFENKSDIKGLAVSGEDVVIWSEDSVAVSTDAEKYSILTCRNLLLDRSHN